MLVIYLVLSSADLIRPGHSKLQSLFRLVQALLPARFLVAISISHIGLTFMNDSNTASLVLLTFKSHSVLLFSETHYRIL